MAAGPRSVTEARAFLANLSEPEAEVLAQALADAKALTSGRPNDRTEVRVVVQGERVVRATGAPREFLPLARKRA